jgi:hypothetical protein
MGKISKIRLNKSGLSQVVGKIGLAASNAAVQEILTVYGGDNFKPPKAAANKFASTSESPLSPALKDSAI